jgi:hypothetical protein
MSLFQRRSHHKSPICVDTLFGFMLMKWSKMLEFICFKSVCSRVLDVYYFCTWHCKCIVLHINIAWWASDPAKNLDTVLHLFVQSIYKNSVFYDFLTFQQAPSQSSRSIVANPLPNLSMLAKMLLFLISKLYLTLSNTWMNSWHHMPLFKVKHTAPGTHHSRKPLLLISPLYVSWSKKHLWTIT